MASPLITGTPVTAEDLMSVLAKQQDQLDDLTAVIELQQAAISRLAAERRP
jgi:hypothetical protein